MSAGRSRDRTARLQRGCHRCLSADAKEVVPCQLTQTGRRTPVPRYRPAGVVLFASTYFLMERASAASFTQPLTRTDALYFTVTVFSTVGFGDITAKSETARVVLIVQMLADLVLLGAGIRVLLGAVQRGRARGSDTGDDAGPAAP